MINIAKNFNVDSTKSNDDVRVIESAKNYYISVFCPRCGNLNVHRHRILKRRYLCDDCGHKWKN